VAIKKRPLSAIHAERNASTKQQQQAEKPEAKESRPYGYGVGPSPIRPTKPTTKWTKTLGRGQSAMITKRTYRSSDKPRQALATPISKGLTDMTKSDLPSKPHGHQLRKHPLPPIEWLKKRFHYEPDTGELFHNPPDMFGNRTPLTTSTAADGYKSVRITYGSHRLNVLSHRLAFAITHGHWPHLIDHRNGNRSDNRSENLQELSNRANVRKGRKVTKARYITRQKSQTAPCGKIWNITSKRNDGRQRHTSRRDFCQAVKLLQAWKAKKTG